MIGKLDYFIIFVKMKAFYHLIATALMLSALTPARAQFRYYTTDQGLPSNTVRSLLQDSEGFVWVGTSSGLCWCNGNEFESCNPPEGEEWDKSIFDICESEDTGTLWVGTFEGIYYIHKNSRTLTRLHVNSYDGPTEDCSVNRIVADNNRNIWIGTIEQGLFRYNISSGKWVNYKGKGPGKTVKDILITNDLQLWLVCQDNCIYKYNTATDDFSVYPVVDRFTCRTMVSGTCVCQDTYGDLWVCDSNCDLWRVDRIDMLCVSSTVHAQNEKLTSRTIMEFNPGELLIGTNLGLLSFDISHRAYSWVDRGGEHKGQLNDKFIYALMKDKAGGLWVGTYFGGINYKSANTNIVKSIYPSAGCGNIISVMAETPDGKVLIGSDDGGLSTYDPLTGSYTRFDVDRNNSNMNVHALLIENDDVWVGTFENGLYKVNRRTGKVRHFDGRFMEDGMKDVYSIFRDNRGSLWIGTTTGIGILDEKADVFRRMINLESRSDVVRVLQDGDLLYFATEKNGLIRYSYETGLFDTVPGEYPKHVTCIEIYEDKLYAGTTHGVYVLNESGSLVQCNSPLLQYFQVCGMVPDYCGLWITTNKGIFCFVTTGERTRFTMEDGFISDRFNVGSILKLSSGAILTGCARGVNSFIPSLLKNGSRSDELRVVIKSIGLMVDGREMVPADFSQGEIIVHGLRTGLSVDFIALNYESQKTNLYRYRLAGHEDDWHYVTSEDMDKGIIYTDIKPSIYTFEVQATRSMTAGFGPVSSVRIRVCPPAKKVIFFIVLSVLTVSIIIAFLSFFYRYRKQKRIALTHKENYLKEALSKTLYEDLLVKIRDYAERTSFDPEGSGKSLLSIADMAGTQLDFSDGASVLNAETVIRSLCTVIDGDVDYSFSGNVTASVRSSDIVLPLCNMVENALMNKDAGVRIKAEASTENVEIAVFSGDTLLESMTIPVADSESSGKLASGPIADLCSKDKFCSELLTTVLMHLSEESLSIDSLAEIMDVSRATIFNKVKNVTGLTPNVLIRKIRMERAAEMLCRPNIRVSEACLKTGFLSNSYFGKLFKVEFGMTPKEFTNKYKDMESYYKSKQS